jgi:hypothetical protein
MAAEDHYHERIARATERLAQLQAKGLLASQRQAAKAKQEQRREEARRRKRVAEIIFAADAQTLDDAELAGALLQFLEERNNDEARESARRLGDALLVHTRAASSRLH